MLRKVRLFTPGPTPLLPAAQFAMAAADMHHRTPEFRRLYSRVLQQLREFIGTKNDVVLLTASGTGAMEAAVSNLTSPGERVLVLAAGKFGERWTALAKAFGCVPTVVSAPYGETFDLGGIRAAFDRDIRAVFMQATETSTAARHDVAAVAELVRESDALLVVDAITGIGTTAFDVDGAGIDVIIGGSQKALMVPPGLAYCAVSERAWSRMQSSKQPRYYFDLTSERKAAAKGEASYTPAVALVAALGAALDYLAAQADGDLASARDQLIHNAETCAAMTRTAGQAMGFKLFAPTAPAAAVTALTPAEGRTSTEFVKALRAQFGAIVADGQGEMKGTLLRIAHLGYFDYLDTIALIGALEQAAYGMATRPAFALGDGLRAAQQEYAARVSGVAASEVAGARR
jgi:aspartate aminotransferase-like enzyme